MHNVIYVEIAPIKPNNLRSPEVENLARSQIRRTQLSGAAGEDSVVFDTNSFLDYTYVFKHPHIRVLSREACYTAKKVAELIKAPLVIANIIDDESKIIVASVVVTEKLAELGDLIENVLHPKGLFRRPNPSAKVQAESFEDINSFFNQKIMMTIACAQIGYLADFDMCNVGVNPANGRVQLFDFGGIRSNISLSNLITTQAKTLEEEAKLPSGIDTSRLHHLSDSMAYRAIRLRDCGFASLIYQDVKPHTSLYDSESARTAWSKYQHVEALAEKGLLFMVDNTKYFEQLQMMQRMTHAYADEITQQVLASVNTNRNTIEATNVQLDPSRTYCLTLV